MKRQFKLFSASAIALMAAVMFNGCSKDNDMFMPEPVDFNEPTTRSSVVQIIDFENATDEFMAGPSSYGENLYDGAVNQYTSWIDTRSGAKFGINKDYNDQYNFWGGGIAISDWDIMENIEGNTGDWWYSYNNQCSVYDVVEDENENENEEKNKFGVIYGYSDGGDFSFTGRARFVFLNNKLQTIEEMDICNTAYSYGVMVHGNTFGIYGEAVSLETAKGWFKVIAYGLNTDGTLNGRSVEKYICDYRESTVPKIPLKDTWESWDLSELGAVNGVEFNFEGSDSGAYGLNTPAYLCIDNIHIR